MDVESFKILNQIIHEKGKELFTSDPLSLQFEGPVPCIILYYMTRLRGY